MGPDGRYSGNTGAYSAVDADSSSGTERLRRVTDALPCALVDRSMPDGHCQLLSLLCGRYVRLALAAAHEERFLERSLERQRFRANPAVIPRNHRVEAMIEAAVAGDYAPFHKLIDRKSVV